MRLLNTATLEFEDFPENKIPKYAILSHTWFKKKEHGSGTGIEQDDEEGETEYKAFMDLRLRPEADWTRSVRKVKKFCDVARSLNIEWGWSDTCCTHQQGKPSELGEAINSMWKWYTSSALCMVYLWDVESPSSAEQPRKAIGDSEWFTRGWTLQELLAPQQMRLYDREWRIIGTRHKLADRITRRTGIEPRFFGNIDLVKGASVARRLFWAAGRTTTKPKDIAYCLVGIMDVYMPPRYGSDKKEAFRVLQLEFTKKYRDQSIFA
ncbi:hypothetical protein GRF29_28g1768088 [Pseudopithomyces chartarum]|uniref:Heterokaryon incompatibility domain-containing protein n=1 Tax=Pseudopithomyces chartarum TaxID=1892770 RepID=A0AAN6M339_9PLEO|nr:hypothetical protein GRF29_28g1768088 [Pseudopithomyces chartarum]